MAASRLWVACCESLRLDLLFLMIEAVYTLLLGLFAGGHNVLPPSQLPLSYGGLGSAEMDMRPYECSFLHLCLNCVKFGIGYVLM